MTPRESPYREILGLVVADRVAAEVDLRAAKGRLTRLRECEAILRQRLGEPPAPTCHSDFALRALRAIGRPARVKEIGDGMAAMGRGLPADPNIRFVSICGALVRRPQVFRRIARGLWTLREWGEPESSSLA